MDIQKFRNLIINNKQKEIIDMLSFRELEEFLNIKNIYNQSFNMLTDIKAYLKKDFKLFLIGIFFDALDFRSYLIHKNIKKKILWELLYEYDHITAIELKKRYFLMFNKSLLDEFKIDDNMFSYMSYLLSDYFFPSVSEKEYINIAIQIIDMEENNNIDSNLIFYCFQLPNETLNNIIQIYEKISKKKFISFIQKFFKGNIRLFFENRISFISHRFNFLISRITEEIKRKNSLELTKHLILAGDLFLPIYNKCKTDLNILDKNVNCLFENIMEFNFDKIFVGDIMNHMNILYSIPFLYILNIDKVAFNKYIKTGYHEINDCNYSILADYLENDFKKLDNFIYDLIYGKNISNTEFTFKLTNLLSYIIKSLFYYYTLMNKYSNSLKENIKEAENDHNKIIEEIVISCRIKSFSNDQYLSGFFPDLVEEEILTVRFLINELVFPFIHKNLEEKEKKIFEKICENKYRSMGNNKIGDEIRKQLYIIGDMNGFFPFKKFEFPIIINFHKSLNNYKNYKCKLIEERLSEVLSTKWKIQKEKNFNITYKNNSIKV